MGRHTKHDSGYGMGPNKIRPAPPRTAQGAFLPAAARGLSHLGSSWRAAQPGCPTGLRAFALGPGPLPSFHRLSRARIQEKP
jgi:hypothetical protein